MHNYFMYKLIIIVFIISEKKYAILSLSNYHFFQTRQLSGVWHCTCWNITI